MSRFIKGEPSKGVTFKKGQTPWNKGKKMTAEYCKKVGDVQRGRKHTPEHVASRFAWRDIESLDRKGKLYQAWLKAVLERDKICQHCGTRKKLVAHHVIDYKNPDGTKNKELMLDVDNGMTLCSSCHAKLHIRQGEIGRKGSIPWNKGLKGVGGWPKGKKRGDPWNKGTKGISGGWETRRKRQEEKLRNIN